LARSRIDQLNEIERLFRDLSWFGRLRFSRRVERFGLTVPQFHTLRAIDRLGPEVTMREVTEQLQLPASSMTSITDRLVRLELVDRLALPFDRRAVAATITAQGRTLVLEIEAEQRRDLGAMLDDVADTDLYRFREVLAHLLAGVEGAIAGDSGSTEAESGERAS